MAMTKVGSTKRAEIVTFGAKGDYLHGTFLGVGELGGSNARTIRVMTRVDGTKPGDKTAATEEVVFVDAELVRFVEKKTNGISEGASVLLECEGLNDKGYPIMSISKGEPADLAASVQEKGAYRHVTENAAVKAKRDEKARGGGASGAQQQAVPKPAQDDDIPF